MAGRGVRRLYDLEVDEISLVDRPANQHGAVVIAKRATEDRSMPMYDEEGYELDEDLLEPGDVAFDESGQQFVMLSDEQIDELGIDLEGAYTDPADYADGDAYDNEPMLVGKAAMPGEMGAAQRALLRNGMKGRAAGNQGLDWAKRNKRLVGAGAGVGAAGFAGGRVSKSLGDDVFNEISKALRGSDAREAVSKLAEIVQDSREEARAAWALVSKLADERDAEDYTELASQYPVAADPRELGGALSRIAKNQATQRDLGLLDRVLSADPVAYDEAGYSGYAENGVMDQIQALAGQAVSKGADFSLEEATVAIFDANPDAYDEYLREQAQG